MKRFWIAFAFLPILLLLGTALCHAQSPYINDCCQQTINLNKQVMALQLDTARLGENCRFNAKLLEETRKAGMTLIRELKGRITATSDSCQAVDDRWKEQDRKKQALIDRARDDLATAETKRRIFGWGFRRDIRRIRQALTTPVH